MADREHARGVRGLLRRMMERSEPRQMAEPPRRIDRAGARRMLRSTGAGAERDGTDTPMRGEPRWLINHASWHAKTLYIAVIGGLMVAPVRVPQHASSSGGLLGKPPNSGAGDQESTMIKKTSAVGVVSMVIASQAVADGAVQWRVEDGGNGHWYELVGLPGQGTTRITWGEAKGRAEIAGGHLATFNSLDESAFVWSQFNSRFIDNVWGSPWCCWLGGYRVSGQTFAWVTGESYSCDSMCGWPCEGGGENALYTGRNYDGPYCCVDFHSDSFQGGKPYYLVEFDADCNSDGIADYGQILAGQLLDSNSTGIPDCCEQGTPCWACARYDLNLNGTIDGADLGVLLAFWGPVSTAFPRADITADGRVDGADLGVLLSNWGPCPQ